MVNESGKMEDRVRKMEKHEQFLLSELHKTKTNETRMVRKITQISEEHNRMFEYAGLGMAPLGS